MKDSIFPRTRSQAPMPEVQIDMSRSPLKDARMASRNKVQMMAEDGGAEPQAELNFALTKLGEKRSPSPDGPEQHRLTKRFKPSPTGNDLKNNGFSSMAHARHLSDPNVLPHIGISLKPKSSSQSSSRQPSPALLLKARAKSVPIFDSTREFPVIDIRDLPNSPTRRTPSTWEPKLKIASVQRKLETIPDVLVESTPARPAAFAEQVTTGPVTPTHILTMPTNIPMSPLTPLPETPRYNKLVNTVVHAEDRFNTDGWGRDLLSTKKPSLTEFNAPVKPPPIRNLRSRLPRPTNSTASSSKTLPAHFLAQEAAVAAPPRKPPAKNADKPVVNAFDRLMGKSSFDKGKGKAVGKQKAAALGTKDKALSYQGRNGIKEKGDAKTDAEIVPSKASTIKTKMKPRTKIQPKAAVSLVLDDEEEERAPEFSNDASIAYPLESLPVRNSPSPTVPPRTSSPNYTPDAEDEQMLGIDNGVLTMTGVEMPAADEVMAELESTVSMDVEPFVPAPEQPEQPFEEATSNSLESMGGRKQIPDGAETNVPQVPSPLFSEITSAAPSPLFSEPESPEGKSAKDDPPQQDKLRAVPDDSNSESVEVPADVPTSSSSSSPKRKRRTKTPHSSLPTRATRSTTLKVSTADEPMPQAAKKTRRNKKVKVSSLEPDTSAIVDNSSTTPLVSTPVDDPLPSESSTASLEFTPPVVLPELNESDLSELSDLPDEFSVEEPLKGDAGEDVDMMDVESASMNSPRASRKLKSGFNTPPRRRSLREKKTEFSASVDDEEPTTAISVMSPEQEPLDAAVNSQTKAKGRGRKSAIPISVSKTQSAVMVSPERDNRPNSAPASPVKLTRNYTDFSNYSYVPVCEPFYSLFNNFKLMVRESKAKFVRPPDPGVLERIQRLNETLDRPLPKLDLTRPNTSLGFNPDDPDSSLELNGSSALSKAGKKPTSKIGLGRPSTVGNASASSNLVNSVLSSKGMNQTKIMSIFGTGSGQMKTGGKIMRGTGPLAGNRFPVTTGVGFGSLGSRGKKASQKPMLPSVQGSPVKGGPIADDDDTEMAQYRVINEDPTIPDTSMSGNNEDIDISELEFMGTSSSKGKEKAKDTGEGSAAMGSRGIMTHSQSTSALPSRSKAASSSTPTFSSMGPPPPPSSPPSVTRRSGLRSSSNSYPSSSSKPQAPPKFVPEATFLEGCTLFVDVWMSDGQDTSDLYIEIAKDMGARIVKSLGPQCTHLVFTAGREKTVDTYFALDETKRPTAVGAAWLRDCKSMATHVNESKYLVDLEEHRPSMTSKLLNEKGEKFRYKASRRQSFIPMFIDDVNDGGDTSMDGSNLSLMDEEEDGLTPLERARLRQSVKVSERK
ncbi:hypothetical protein D9757_006475 [Collybiopsis confluens]|uniref:BRCT domain-containing protein n=1 Tax=Collybiopsis confluens TaxID=2823264 RepID=A0A8H5HJL0_9AGAR|nr:hypothetical protein D9757_006475 [Collybiopsis confluens]